MCACVMTIAFTFSACLARMAMMSSMLSPGSMTMASRVCSSPKIEQLHCSMPTGRISWIIARLYTQAYDRSVQCDDAMAAYQLDDVASWRRVVRAARGITRAGHIIRGDAVTDR